jgi:hypothetical protein
MCTSSAFFCAAQSERHETQQHMQAQLSYNICAAHGNEKGNAVLQFAERMQAQS